MDNVGNEVEHILKEILVKDERMSGESVHPLPRRYSVARSHYKSI